MNGDAEKVLEWFLLGGESASAGDEEQKAEYGSRVRPLVPFNMTSGGDDDDDDVPNVPESDPLPLVRAEPQSVSQ
jgi:hypothetical protein